MATSIPQTAKLSPQPERTLGPLLRVAAGAVALAAGVASLVVLGASAVLVAALLAALGAVVLAQDRARRALAAENLRLGTTAARATRELHASRARIAASAERERQRIERDLHDGAQQRLVALRIELQLAEELIVKDPALAVARLRELGGEVDEALEELRALAHGVYPPLLADRGLVEALRASFAHAALPVTLRADGVGRCALEIEGAVYFCVLEAVQNACKHATGASGITIALDGTGRPGLRITIADDGGGPPPGGVVPGAGITNMRDRLAAIGGRVEIGTARGGGCAVRVAVPDRAALSAAAVGGA